MPPRHAPVPTALRAARSIVELAREQGGTDDALAAAYARFISRDDEQLWNAVEQLPCEARQGWTAALQKFPVGPLISSADRQLVMAHIAEHHQPVSAAGCLFELVSRHWDPADRRRRGAYSTPRPLVDLVLGLARELAAAWFPAGGNLHVIDPACGYGAFLHRAGLWFPQAAVSGLEICPRTSSVSQLLAVLESPAIATTVTRTNPLAVGEALREHLLGAADQPLVPIIVGNPPWANFGRQNRSTWIQTLLADYRAGLGERKTNLADDAIKFLRWGQYWIEAAGAGILAFVTPRTWVDGLTHRRMRSSLLETFDHLLIVDLGGDGNRPEDENVFGVRSGVAGVVGVRSLRRGSTSKIHGNCRYIRLTGQCREKLTLACQLTAGSPGWLELVPMPPTWSFAHRASAGAEVGTARALRDQQIYEQFWPLDQIFQQFVSGVQTKNDAVFVGFSRNSLARQVQDWLTEHPSEVKFDEARIVSYLVAPFDRRFVYYDPRLLGRARLAVLRHMLQPNLGLVFMRQSTNPGQYDHFLAVDSLVSDRVFYSRHGAPYLAPLWLFSDLPGRPPAANFTLPFLAAVAERIERPPDPRALFDYLYAVAYAPPYRAQFASELPRGFPRLPLPAGDESFRELAAQGRKLVDLHVGGELDRTESPCEDEKASGKEIEPFRLGGYDVVARWSKPRLRRESRSQSGYTADDERKMAHIRTIGRETRRLMGELEQHVAAVWR
jgi:hypothetical protein